MASNKVTIQETNKGQFFITLPKSLVNMKGWKKGDKLEFVENRVIKELVIKEVV